MYVVSVTERYHSQVRKDRSEQGLKYGGTDYEGTGRELFAEGGGDTGASV